MDSSDRPVLVPAGNKARIVVEPRKPTIKKPQPQPHPQIDSKMRNLSAPSILRHGNQLLRGNSSLNASCSSDASSDSSHSRASTGKINRSSVPRIRRKFGVGVGVTTKLDVVDHPSSFNKRCAWVTPNTGMILYLMDNYPICLANV